MCFKEVYPASITIYSFIIVLLSSIQVSIVITEEIELLDSESD